MLSPSPVILSPFALPFANGPEHSEGAQGKLREGSRHLENQSNTEILRRLRLLRMTNSRVFQQTLRSIFMNQRRRRTICFGIFLLMMMCHGPSLFARGASIFNVRDFGATGVKADDARPAIQKAIDACAAAGGGEVYVPAGEYTSGTLKLRSHVRIYLEAGATLFGSTDPKAFNGEPIPSQAALFYGEGVRNISIEGRGTVDGQAKYVWRLDDPDDMHDLFIRPAKLLMKSLGKSLMRDFPEGYPQRTVYPHLVYLGHCKDVRITGLSFLHS